MKINIIKIAQVIVFFSLATSFNSCKYLESEEYLHEVNNLNDIWTSRKNIREAWAACFGHIPNFTSIETDWPFSGGGDEGHAGRDQYTALLLSQGKYGSDNIPSQINYWTKMYRAIRVCNQFLENSIKANDKLLAPGEVESYQADIRFLRAFYYSLILEIYGPFVIVDKTIDYSSSEYPTTRATIEECVNFIVSELDVAIQALPVTSEITRADLGRPSKAVAMATKARVLLWAASPLVNGNLDYSSFVNKEGDPLFYQNADLDRWKKAADAYHDIISLNQFELFTVPANDSYISVPLGNFEGNDVPWPNGPAGIDPYRSFKGLFAGGDNYWNSEAIWQVSLPNQNANLTYLGWPRGHKASSGTEAGKVSAVQKMVDAFFMNNGKPIEQENRSLYNDIGTAEGSDDYYILGLQSSLASPIVTNFLAGQAAPIPPNRVLNREPRFYATLGFQGRGYKQDDLAKPYYYVDYRAQTADGYIETDRPSVRSGYSVVKYVNDSDTKGDGSYEKQYPVYRLAEVYLSYAEALNEYDSGNPDILKYLNKVRFRAGLPGYTSGSQEENRERIKHERYVEFAFEGKRYFDVRRWKDAEKLQRDSWGNTLGVGGSIYGSNYNATDISFYDRTIIDGYVFKKKNYFLPIPYVDVANHWGELLQNSGY